MVYQYIQLYDQIRLDPRMKLNHYILKQAPFFHTVLDLKVLIFKKNIKNKTEIKETYFSAINEKLTNNGENHYDEVKHIPAQFKVVQPHCNQTYYCLYNEDPGEDIVQIS